MQNTKNIYNSQFILFESVVRKWQEKKAKQNNYSELEES